MTIVSWLFKDPPSWVSIEKVRLNVSLVGILNSPGAIDGPVSTHSTPVYIGICVSCAVDMGINTNWHAFTEWRYSRNARKVDVGVSNPEPNWFGGCIA
jgi:hypothetical protein